ncbi:unnamed protein product, partial [Iphiclides podalirius]
MPSKANVTLNALIFLVFVAFANVLRFPAFPINEQTKRSLGYPGDSLLNFTELTGHYGYASEEHSVVTDDGCVLRLFRITRGRKHRGRTRRPPVILMHGLLQSSDAWLDAGPEAGLAYLLADAGFDLWVGNVRGNYYSRGHVRLDADKDAEYWQFSVDEIGRHDVPATINYVLKYTNSERVNYIGFSQGAGTYFVMCSERPEYCDKARVLVALAPAARQTNTKSLPYRTLMESVRSLEGVLKLSGVQEVFSKGALSQEFLAFFCQFSWLTEYVCGIGEALFDSFHPGSIRNETLRTLFGHFPAGTSVHNLVRYGQSMRSAKFEKFDYGKTKNLEVYGSSRPPEYNLSAVTLPVMVLYGESDHLVDPKDVFWLVSKLPNVVETVKVDDPLWNHLDVTYSSLTKDRIFPKIYDILLKYSD